jgi:acetyl/propionyl-CoA carboxylase alpha subunit/acetyl-CoA carboxylase carboxyltransferase component
MGIVFIGPNGEVMRRIGDKIAAKRLAEGAQIPVVPWSDGPVDTVSQAVHQASLLGFPILIKATSGGGGRGIRQISSLRELPQAFEAARSEAFKAFGDPTVFLERPVTGAHHVEVQIIADHFGTTWAAGVRDCTIQRRHQKVLEEAPSPILSTQQDLELRAAAVRMSKAADYQNAGTVEFLFDPKGGQFWFMEMNTRLQVEHPVTECTTGIDLVKLQIHVARGGRLEGPPPITTGHAIEVRLNAEDPEIGFAPAPGTIQRLRILTGPGIRVDTGVAEGDCVAPEFDSMIAKIIAHGRNRKEALARLRRTLEDSVVVIEGGTSNKSFLLELLNRDEVQRGHVHTGWLDQLAHAQDHVSRKHAAVALVHAAMLAYDTEMAVEQAQFFAAAARGRPQVRAQIGRTVSLRYRDKAYSIKVHRLGRSRYRVDVNASRIDVEIEHVGEFEHRLNVFGQNYRVVSVAHLRSYRVEVNGIAHRVDRDDGGVVYSPSPSVVVSINVKVGDAVSVGDRLAVLEAMKMEMKVVAPFFGVVREILTMPNVQVDTGAPLLRIDPNSAPSASDSAEDIEFQQSLAANAAGQTTEAICRRSLEELRQLMLGFDVDPKSSGQLLTRWSQSCPADSEDIRQAEDNILRAFVDICSLFQRDPSLNRQREEPSAEAHFFAYLRMLDSRGEDLPSSFVASLKRALAHYGIGALDRSPELEESLLWICKSHQRVEQQIAAILGILERRLERAGSVIPHVEESFRILLDRMIFITNGSFAALSDLAREVRYRYFDQPLFERTRGQIYAHVEEQLSYIAQNPTAADRHEVFRALVECPQPLMTRLSAHFSTADPLLRGFMLELILSRYYRIRTLTGVHSTEVEGRCWAAAEYNQEGRQVHLLATHSDYLHLAETVRAMSRLIDGVPADHDIVVDFYTWHDASLDDAETIQRSILKILNEANYSRPIQRVVVTVSGPGRGEGLAGMYHFSYSPVAGAYAEDKFYRGIHPMMGERLHLWRLKNFDIERLPAVEDVYLLHAVARDNPKDERLFACAEVRDVTPVRDETGRAVQLPHLERMLAEALAGIRRIQAHRRPHERLHWNRVFLYVWPPLNLDRDEVNEIAHRLAPSTEGLGLEQVVLRARIPNPTTGELRDMMVRISMPGGSGVLITFRPADKVQLIRPLAEYEQKVVRMRQRGFIYPYEIIKMLTPGQDTRAEFPPGDFVEHDLDSENRLVPVLRPYGKNTSNIIVGVIRNFTAAYPEGMTRVLLLGDPSRDLGALAESECRRILAALDLAQKKGVPLEWFPVSAGAKISMESGVENMDWIARVLRRLIEFTQAGGEVNLLINGINVGAQPYWNAEATMLMHTRGILVMTPKAAMVLTGKRALDYSGSVSAEDNQGIGGYARIMGINGQAQYWARDIDHACRILMSHYDHTYIAPGERFPRKASTEDPVARDIRVYPHGESGQDGFRLIGDILSDETNPGRKKAFEIRKVMMAVIDQDHSPLERWAGMRAADTTVVWDAHMGGYPVCLIGIESRPTPRFGFVPADGPDQWCAGTLFPQSSKKVARAINAASNNRPLVILANLSGFDGSPESMRRLQLEYGAEIGRAVVNFKGPIVFCVISRYHGGAYVVFSRALNEQLEVAALEGTYASVIGGAPAAAVVFAGEVEARTKQDSRIKALSQAIDQASAAEKIRLRRQLDELFKVVHSEKLGEMAAEFDRVHSVKRALEVGALDRIIPPAELRPYLIDAVERGIARAEESAATAEIAA